MTLVVVVVVMVTIIAGLVLGESEKTTLSKIL